MSPIPIPVPSPGEVVDWTVRAVKYLRGRGRRQLESRWQTAQAVRSRPELVNLLEEFYQIPLLRRGELAFPVAVWPCPPAQAADVDSLLGAFDERPGPSPLVADRNYLGILEIAGKKIHNGRTFVMNSATVQGQMSLNVGMGYYHDAMTSCDALEWELLCALRPSWRRRSFTRASVSPRLPLRRAYHEINPVPHLDGTARSAMISVSTLIVFKDGKTYRALIWPRSQRTAAHAGLYHVSPSGIFQPQFAEPKREFSIKLTILREYLEEVVGAGEFEESDGGLSADRVYSHPKTQSLLGALNEQRAELVLTGYAMDAANLRPEVCALLLIHDENWWKTEVSRNWEFRSQRDLDAARIEVVPPLDVLQDDAAIIGHLLQKGAAFVPTGAAALWLGIDTVRNKITEPPNTRCTSRPPKES